MNPKKHQMFQSNMSPEIFAQCWADVEDMGQHWVYVSCLHRTYIIHVDGSFNKITPSRNDLIKKNISVL